MKVIKVGAIWCSGCLVMRPRWQKVEEENPWLETEYYDYDEDKKELDKHNIDAEKLPIFIFLDKNENEITRLTGEISEKKLLEAINKYKDE